MDLRVARPHALVAAFVALAAVAPAHAEIIDLPDTRAELVLDTRTWRALTVPPVGTSSGLVYGASTDRERLSITRAQVPNIDAWRSKTRDAYVEQIEKGLAAAGYKPTSKKLTTIQGVPVLDLEATVDNRAGARSATTSDAKTAKREPIVMRVILFRTYALTLAIEGPSSSRRALRAIAKTFVPPPARPEGSP